MSVKNIEIRLLNLKLNKNIVFFLLNGTKVKGILKDCGQYTLTIENEQGFLETYYKHIISKICWGKAQFYANILNNQQEQAKNIE